MGATTSRLAIPYPVASDPNNVPSDMQALAARLDSILGLEGKGLLSARPAAGNEGFKYFATDAANGVGGTGVLYYDNGAAWVAVNPQLTAAEVLNAADKSAAGAQAFTGAVTAPAVAANVSGTTGRYVGTTNGAPTSGTFQLNDFASDPTNLCFWICTAGGAPGTWAKVGGSGHVSARVYMNGAYTLASNGDIVFDTVDYDALGMYSNSTGKFTVPLAGIYAVSATVVSTTTTADGTSLGLFKNGSDYATGPNNCNTAGFNVGADIQTTVKCAAGDTVNIHWFGTTQSAATGTGGSVTWATIHYVGPA